mmetsp:Transcript_20890/g.58048  ORF Transcript_20890/g.58048 Transcript_20890/m.58048 type:complete len:1903 (-) Transcript_20890:59-5767(-)
MTTEETSRHIEDSRTDETTAAIASTKNFQDEVRQWFTAMSSEERAAALGFEDEGPLMATLMATVTGRFSSCCSTTSHNNDGNNSRRGRTNSGNINQDSAPTCSLPPKRMTDKLNFNDTCDWEARIALEIIEKTWEEIMMVGEPNTSGVNQKDFVKNSFKKIESETKHELHVGESTIDNKDKKIVAERGSTDSHSGTKTCRTENNILNDGNHNEILSDAYRILSDGVDVEGKPASADEINCEAEVAAPATLKSCETGKEDEKGKVETNEEDVGSSCSSGANDESSDECTSPREITPVEPATSSTISSKTTSAINGIKGDLEYHSDNNNSRRISDVMNNTRCIFPAASEILTTATIGDNTKSHELQHQYQETQNHRQKRQPFITINPSYLNSVSGDELLVAFDEIMAMACTNPLSDDPCSFILPEEATSASWLDLVRSYATTDAAAADAARSIPLYMLVLCRFQYSLAKAYAEHTETPTECDDDSGEKEKSFHKSRADWLSALITRIGELENKQSTEIQQIRSKLASNLPQPWKSSDDVSDSNKCDLERYLLLPFSVLTRHSGNESEKPVEPFDSGNNADPAMEASAPDGKVSVKGETPSDNSQDSNCNGTTGTTEQTENANHNRRNHASNTSSSGARKGKKKKKKKKRRAGTSGNTSAKPQIPKKNAEAETSEKSETEEKAPEPEATDKIEGGNMDRENESSVLNVVGSKDELHPTPSEPPSVTPCVTRDIDLSTKTATNSVEETKVTEPPEKTEKDEGNNVHVSKTDGPVSSAAPQSKIAKEQSTTPKKETPKDTHSGNNEDHLEEQWETVEVRPRGRKKTSDKGHHQRLGSQGNSGNSNGQHGTNAKKKNPRTKETRARIKTRKMVREILGGVLDAVEENVRRRRNASRERAHLQRNQSVSASSNKNSTVPGKKSGINVTPQNSKPQKNLGSSLRDILVRGNLSNQNQQAKNTNTTKLGPTSYSERAKSLLRSETGEEKKVLQRKKSEKPSHITGSKTNKALKAARASPADQNTLPTIASTNSAFTASVTKLALRKQGAAQSTDSSESESAESKKLKKTPSEPTKYVSPSPPLPTLLSPENNNSSSSSVASSLDAPHAGHHGNKLHQSDNDVGCHLLNICDRLSTEVVVFMKRRDAALVVRRQERGLVLAALEKTLDLIWPGKPTVEMYGSCATNLDLPSSDLDVVVCGLNRPYVDLDPSPTNTPSVASNSPGTSSPVEDDNNKEDGSPETEGRQDAPPYISGQRYSQHQMTSYQMQMMYGHMSVNGERVLRLAMELEHQPWAVHVKPIPTATVPVIKILADPTRLPGAAMNGNADWRVQQPIHGQSHPTIGPHGRSETHESRHGNQTHMSHYGNQQSSPIWRGADVVNGLLNVDITFEGPEHGGIGSTKFSKEVVKDFSNESELSAECTPQVQVLMVLKELLAQRRSNEPFSGGLSSYALLILVISMIRERKLIREELEKTERQRRVVAAGGGNSAPQSTQLGSMESAPNDESKSTLVKNQNKTFDPSNPEETEQKYSQVVSQRIGSTPKTTVTQKEQAKNTAWKEKPTKSEQAKQLKKTGATVAPALSQKLKTSSSWANIARNSSSPSNLSASEKKQDDPDKSSETKSGSVSDVQDKKVPKKPSSFADAVAKGKTVSVAPATSTNKKDATVKKTDGKKRFDGLLDPPSSRSNKHKVEKEQTASKPQQTKENGDNSEDQKSRTNAPSTFKQSKGLPVTSAESNISCSPDSSGFPQGFHDVIEVLCSGETTPGKLLMHFLLFYGQHFESQSTAIDYSGTHQRDPSNNNGYSVRSSYILRRNAGAYDPVTGMYTVDPIVVYDPLEGAENSNVARSCFAWSSIRWVFAQSYMTLSSAAEQNDGDGTRNRTASGAAEGPSYGHDESGNVVVDPSSPLLELLLSY